MRHSARKQKAADPVTLATTEYERAALAARVTPSDQILARDARTAAWAVSNLLGHLALRQGNSVECAKCGRSGAVTPTSLTGAIHTERCV